MTRLAAWATTVSHQPINNGPRKGRIALDDAQSTFCIDPARVSIARLTDNDVEHMSRDDLVDLVTIARCRLATDLNDGQLRQRDTGELRELVFLVRRMCRDLSRVRSGIAH